MIAAKLPKAQLSTLGVKNIRIKISRRRRLLDYF